MDPTVGAQLEQLRPELHRYCARLTGSIVDGEDVVQEALAKAVEALAESATPPPLRPLLFRIAHNTAIDSLRRYEHRFVDAVAELPDEALAARTEPIDPEAVRAALRTFLRLPVAQRSAVILKDVLGCSLDEIVEWTGATLPSVKAALVRGRTTLREQAARVAGADSDENEAQAPTPIAPSERAQLHRYTALFNARDWESLRALLAEDCRLDLVSKAQRRGRAVGEYFGRYADLTDLRLVAGTLEGRPALALYHPAASPHPCSFILLTWQDQQLALIRDFRYVSYIADEVKRALVRFEPVDP